MIRFIHAADIHIDSPLIGLGRYEGAPVEQIRNATRKALENLVHLAITEQVKFVLIAGISMTVTGVTTTQACSSQRKWQNSATRGSGYSSLREITMLKATLPKV